MNTFSSLRAFYASAVLPLLHSSARHATLREYEWTLRKWESVFPALALENIDAFALARFRDSLSSELSPATVNKHLRH